MFSQIRCNLKSKTKLTNSLSCSNAIKTFFAYWKLNVFSCQLYSSFITSDWKGHCSLLVHICDGQQGGEDLSINILHLKATKARKNVCQHASSPPCSCMSFCVLSNNTPPWLAMHTYAYSNTTYHLYRQRWWQYNLIPSAWWLQQCLRAHLDQEGEASCWF